MIFPSKGSCSNICGISDSKSDCSCHRDCLRESNCCDDFDKECQSEISKLLIKNQKRKNVKHAKIVRMEYVKFVLKIQNCIKEIVFVKLVIIIIEKQTNVS